MHVAFIRVLFQTVNVCLRDVPRHFICRVNALSRNICPGGKYQRDGTSPSVVLSMLDCGALMCWWSTEHCPRKPTPH